MSSAAEGPELRRELKRLIVEALDLRGKTEEDIGDDEPLFGGRLALDSLDALELAVALENRYGVSVPEGDEGRRVFGSVTALAEFVTNSRASKPAR